MGKRTNKISFEECVDRVKKINDGLKEFGYDWKQIDQFWAEIFTKFNNKSKKNQDHENN